MISIKSTYLTLFVLAAAVVPPGFAQYTQQGGKLSGVATTATAGEGSSVALSGDSSTAAIAGNSESAVWIFTRNNGIWFQQGGKLSVAGCSGAASPGCSVALSADGNTLLVGAPFDNAGVGSAWVFVRGAGGVWSQQGNKLAGSDSVGPSEQGYSVALSGDGNTALVGGALDAAGAGAAWVYTRNNSGVWSQQGAKLVGTGAVGGAWQGNGVALSLDGSTAASGGPFDANFVGATWVFTRNGGGVWSQQGAKLVGTGSSGGAYQGQSVSISAGGSTLLVGGPKDNIYIGGTALGAAWVFTRGATGTWTQQGGKLTANDSVYYPVQGQSVSISGDGNTAVVGGPGDNFGQGAAWIYTRNNLGVWTQQGTKLLGANASGTSAAQGQGVSISSDGSTILVGGPGDNAGLGAAWPFALARLSVTAPTTAVANTPVNFTVSLLDSNNAPFGAYTGTLHFTSTDASAVLPVDTTMPSGTGTFSATFKTGGNQTVTVTDAAHSSISGTSGGINVTTAVQPATHFSVTALSVTTAGSAFNVTVTALNAGNQTVTGYSGTVHFTSTDNAAVLPANATLTNGTGTFPVTLNTTGSQTISATDTATAAITGTSAVITVSTAIPLGPTGASPPSGNTATATFLFSFYDPRGPQDFGVLDILINNFLDGRNACYIAADHQSGAFYLVDDNGATLLPFSGTTSASNSQCTVTLGVINIAAAAIPVNTILVPLNITFKPAFAGNKVIYMAARDVSNNNSGWQAMGVWTVPGSTPTTSTSVTGMTPDHGTGLGPSPFTFSFADTKGFQDLGVVDILVNNFLDGRHACYLAYSRPGNVLYLVNDNGDALLPGQSLAAGGTITNSQCTVTWGASAVTATGNDLTLNLNIAFSASFSGNRVFYLAARDVNEANNTDWQAMGTWAVR